MDVPLNHLLHESPPRQLFSRALHILSTSGDAMSPSTRHAVFSAALDSIRTGTSLCALQSFRQCAEAPDTQWTSVDWTATDETALRFRADRALRTATAIAAESDKKQSKQEEEEEEEEEEEDEGVGKTKGEEGEEAVLLMRCGEWFKAHVSLAGTYVDIGDFANARRQLRRVLEFIQSHFPLQCGALAALEALVAAVELWIVCGDMDTVRKVLSPDGIAPLTAMRTATVISDTTQTLTNIHTKRLTRLRGRESLEDRFAPRLAHAVLSLSLARALCALDEGDFACVARSFSGAGLRGLEWAPHVEEWATRRHTQTLSSTLAGRIAQFPVPRAFNAPHSTRMRVSHASQESMTNGYGSGCCGLPPVLALRETVAHGIASAPQFGAIFVLSAVSALSRSAALELFARADTVQLFSDIPPAMSLVRATEKAQFGEVVKAAEVLTSAYVLTDIIAHKHCDALREQFRHKVIASFTCGFARLRVDHGAERLGIAAETLRRAMRQLTVRGELRGRVDEVQQQWRAAEEEAEEDLQKCLRCAEECSWDLEQSLRLLGILRSRN